MRLYWIGAFCYIHYIPFIPMVCNFFIRVIHNSVVYCETEIGKGTVFAYGGIAVVIHRRVKIGSDCVLGPHITIGGRSKIKNVPVIGSRVYLGAGCKILGDVHIGDNSIVGANAVVIKDVAPNSIVVGIPAKVIKSGINPAEYY